MSSAAARVAADGVVFPEKVRAARLSLRQNLARPPAIGEGVKAGEAEQHQAPARRLKHGCDAAIDCDGSPGGGTFPIAANSYV